MDITINIDPMFTAAINRLAGSIKGGDVECESPVKAPEPKAMRSILDASIRSQNALARYGIYKLSSLMYINRQDLFRFPNVGRKSIKELEGLCRERGIVIGSKRTKLFDGLWGDELREAMREFFKDIEGE